MKGYDKLTRSVGLAPLSFVPTTDRENDASWRFGHWGGDKASGRPDRHYRSGSHYGGRCNEAAESEHDRPPM